MVDNPREDAEDAPAHTARRLGFNRLRPRDLTSLRNLTNLGSLSSRNVRTLPRTARPCLRPNSPGDESRESDAPKAAGHGINRQRPAERIVREYAGPNQHLHVHWP